MEYVYESLHRKCGQKNCGQKNGERGRELGIIENGEVTRLRPASRTTPWQVSAE